MNKLAFTSAQCTVGFTVNYWSFHSPRCSGTNLVAVCIAQL